MDPALPKAIRICHLYPRLFSVAGDRGNLIALTKRCAWRGIRTSVTEADVGVSADFRQFDLILVHGGQDCEMKVAARDLETKAGSLREAIEGGTVVLAVCAGYQLLGTYYAPVDGRPITGLGVLNAVTEGGSTRFMSHIAVTCDLGQWGQRLLVGFENHSGRTYLGPGTDPLGRVIAGSGNNGEDGTEGARYRDVYATYLHGPVLPKNPWLTDHLISRALMHRYQDAGALDWLVPLNDQTEAEAHAAALGMARRPSPARPAILKMLRLGVARRPSPARRRAGPRPAGADAAAAGDVPAAGEVPAAGGVPAAGEVPAAGGVQAARNTQPASEGMAWTSH
jgi:lipid II isoglutaminyl synthase (glutamine-hydrolysing)